MRILLITDALVLGGAETFALRLTRALRAAGHKAELLCLNPDIEDPRLVAQFPDLTIHRVPKTGLRTLKRADRAAGTIGLDPMLQNRWARRWTERHLIGRFDVYHTHLFAADWLLTTIRRKHPDIRIVSTLHGDYALHERRSSGTEQGRVRRWPPKLRETLAAVRRWVTISPEQREQFVDRFGVNPRTMVEITNGYAPPAPVERIERPFGDRLTFVMVARGMREKGWGYLVEAFGKLRGDAALLLVGEGAYLDELKARHGDDPAIRFAGAHPNPVEMIAAADVFVHPSVYRAESMPTVIIEALYAGRPVVATRVGSAANMIQTPDGALAGQLIEAEETLSVADLAAAMQAYLDDPALVAAHAAHAPAAFAKFDMATCARAYERLYADAIGPVRSATS